MPRERLQSLQRVCAVLADLKHVAEQAVVAVDVQEKLLDEEREELINAFNGNGQLQAFFASEIARGLHEISLKAAVLRDNRLKAEKELAAASMKLEQAKRFMDRLEGLVRMKRERRELEDIIENHRATSLP
jgi:hypothetical protein